MSDEREEYASWWLALSRDPEYYTNTEQGQKELADMIRKESERLLDEIGKLVKPTKEIIWLSNYCNSCHYFRSEGRKTSCEKWHVRIVKPFHGQALWKQIPAKAGGDEKELVVEGIDWDTRWKEVSEKIVDMAVGMVNGGYPYFCYKGT
ncbi:MAG: hypothetical protein JRN28_00640 [Nitrososphaerota archaeon]|nr:hypothetical protein [Nitrososphaerota archaeon]